MATLSFADALRAAYQAGFRGASLIEVVGLAQGESRLNTAVPSTPNPGGGTNIGILQIDVSQWQSKYPSVTAQSVSNPLGAFRAAFLISQGGANFSPWATNSPSDPNYWGQWLGPIRAAALGMAGPFQQAAFAIVALPGGGVGSVLGGHGGSGGGVGIPDTGVPTPGLSLPNPLSGIGDAIGGAVSGAVHTVVLVLLGLVLVVLGAWMLTPTETKDAMKQTAMDAGKAAAV